MRKLGVLVVAALVAGSLVGSTVASADPCREEQNTVIFSAVGAEGVAFAGTPNSAVVVCIAAPEVDDVGFDPHQINPGSTHISVRHTADLDASIPELTIQLSGLGLDGQSLTAARTPFATGGFTYDTPRVALPDPSATGAVTATVFVEFDGDLFEIDEVTFHKYV